VTSLSELAGRDVTLREVSPIVERNIAEVFELDLEPAPGEVRASLEPSLVS
jgi:hypothetical protein